MVKAFLLCQQLSSNGISNIQALHDQAGTLNSDTITITNGTCSQMVRVLTKQSCYSKAVTLSSVTNENHNNAGTTDLFNMSLSAAGHIEPWNKFAVTGTGTGAYGSQEQVRWPSA